MSKWKKVLLAAVGYLVVFGAVALIPVQPAHPQSNNPPLNVKVTNTPLPVSGNVNATVGGTVQAQQSGAWSVGINGTPSVTVTGLPAVQLAPGTNVGISGTPTVNVGNTSNVSVASLPAVQLAPGASVGINGTPNVNVSSLPAVQLAPGANVGISGTPTVHIGDTPLPVFNVVGQHVQPFQRTVLFAFLPGDTAKDGGVDVPGGARLIIEHASAFAKLAQGAPNIIQVTTTNSTGNGSDQLADHFLVGVRTGADSGFGYFAASQELRAASDAGVSSVRIHIERDDSGSFGSARVTLSGYLVGL